VFGPKLLQLQLIPELAGNPTTSPPPGPMQLELIEQHFDPQGGGVIRNVVLGRIKGEFSGLLAGGVEDINDFRPGHLLAVVDLAKIKQMLLRPATTGAHLLGYTPIGMILPVFKAAVALQKWLGLKTKPNSKISASGRG
jgi:hypothetical protein